VNKFKALFSDRKILVIFLLGFLSGLPLLLTGSTLQAWCKDSGMSLSTIGLFSWVGAPYALKVLWSPFLDWITPSKMGRRRSWLIIAQVGMAAALLLLAATDPKSSIVLVAGAAILVAVMSSTFDISVDAYQIETLPREAYALGNQFYVIGYRIGMLLAGGGSLVLADHMSFPMVYALMAAISGVGILVTLFAKEPVVDTPMVKTFTGAFVEPVKDFFSSNGSHKGKALWIIAFFLLYKLGCDLATSLNTVFYMDIGFTKTQIGLTSKSIGFFCATGGAIVGGTGFMFFGLRRSLWIFGALQALSVLSFAWVNEYVMSTHDLSAWALGVSIGVENFIAAMGTAAYATFMAACCVNRRYTATQYALLSSLMSIPRMGTGYPAGLIAQNYGWTNLFIVSVFVSIPGLLILWKLQRNDDPALPQGTFKAA
jgi:PAT family beta-lactamase induction signal transducer AmpG